MNTKFCPRNRSRASANAVIESNSSSSSVVPPAKTNVLTTSRPNGSWVVTARKPASDQWPGHNPAGSAYRSDAGRNATLIIQRNGISDRDALPRSSDCPGQCAADAADAAGATRRADGRARPRRADGQRGTQSTSRYLSSRSWTSRDGQDDQEQHPGDRAGVAEVEVHEALLVQVLTIDSVWNSGPPPVIDVRQVEQLQTGDGGDDDGEQQRRSQRRQRDVPELAPARRRRGSRPRTGSSGMPWMPASSTIIVKPKFFQMPDGDQRGQRQRRRLQPVGLGEPEVCRASRRPGRPAGRAGTSRRCRRPRARRWTGRRTPPAAGREPGGPPQRLGERPGRARPGRGTRRRCTTTVTLSAFQKRWSWNIVG